MEVRQEEGSANLIYFLLVPHLDLLSPSYLLDSGGERIHLGAVGGHGHERCVVGLELGLVDHLRDEPVLDPVQRLRDIDRRLPRDPQIAVARHPGVEVSIDGFEQRRRWCFLRGVAMAGKEMTDEMQFKFKFAPLPASPALVPETQRTASGTRRRRAPRAP